MLPVNGLKFVRRTKLHWLLLMILFLAACGSTSNTPSASPTPKLTFTSVDLGIPADALNSPVVGTLDSNTQMKVNILFKLNQNQQQRFQQVANNQQDLEKEANQIGITDAQFQQIKNDMSSQGVTLTLSKLHTSVEVDGPAQALARLFQVKSFENHNYQNRTFYAPQTAPQVPTQVKPLIVSITGLDSYAPPMHTGFAAQTLHAKAQTNGQADCQGLAGTVSNKDVAHAYGYDQLNTTGKGLTVNLIEIDGFSQADVTNYGSCVGYQGNLTVKTIGATPTQAEGESTLDIEMIQGLAPDANIVDYQTNDATNTGIEGELQQLIDDNTNNAGDGNVVSISLGGGEDQNTVNDLNAIDQQLSVLTNDEHMTVFVASGDCGAFSDGVFGVRSVSFPASDPNVVAVGGTTLQTDSNGSRTDESVWTTYTPDPTQCNNTWGSGGGDSQQFSLPSWQTGQGVQKTIDSTGGREVPDIAAVADNLPIYFGGQWIAIGGTSAATPIWAAGMTLINQATIDQYGKFFVGPSLFYYVANNPGSYSPYFDVTNGGGFPSATFPSTSNWDFATGWGTPNLPDIYQILAAQAATQ